MKKLIYLLLLSSFMMPLDAIKSSLSAAEIKWEKTSYTHYSQKESIKDLLADFFSNQGIGFNCSEEVKHKISGQFKTTDPKSFFEDIALAYNLIWYFDGASVYVYATHEMTSQILNLGYIDMKAFKENLELLDIIDERFELKLSDEDRIIFVSGPPRYVQLVAELAEKLDLKAMNRRGRDDIISVFPLKHAWADDKTLYFQDKELVIPGVATLLRNVLTGNTSPGEVVGSENQRALSQTVKKLKGTGLSKNRKMSPATAAGAEPHTGMENENDLHHQDEAPHSKRAPDYIDTDVGVIQADPRQNAVLVRDREEKVPYYEKIIALLDVPVELVEIRATIMDIDRENIEELGIAWQFTSTSTDNQSITSGGLNSQEPFSPKQGLAIPVGDGFNIATILGDSRNFFLSQINALQKKGNAEILSRPSVMTLNNVEAQLEHSKTFYVRVAGTEEVDLFDITAGVVLRVTPHVIEDKTGNRIKLAIQIKDGNFSTSDQTVDDIPVVSNSIINTQAVIRENESLLIGGYLRDEKYSQNKQVPCLGDIPLVGWLFKSRSSDENRAERLFLITPTIVPYDSSSIIE